MSLSPENVVRRYCRIKGIDADELVRLWPEGPPHPLWQALIAMSKRVGRQVTA